MITANELRLGNYVSISTVYHADDVRLVDTRMIDAVYNGFEAHPIPLTEERLMKAGFVNEFTGHQEDDVMRLQIKKNFMIDYDLNYMQLAINQEGDIVDADHIKSVHQLQNLYFALTGQELNIEI